MNNAITSQVFSSPIRPQLTTIPPTPKRWRTRTTHTHLLKHTQYTHTEHTQFRKYELCKFHRVDVYFRPVMPLDGENKSKLYHTNGSNNNNNLKKHVQLPRSQISTEKKRVRCDLWSWCFHTWVTSNPPFLKRKQQQQKKLNQLRMQSADKDHIDSRSHKLLLTPLLSDWYPAKSRWFVEMSLPSSSSWVNFSPPSPSPGWRSLSLGKSTIILVVAFCWLDIDIDSKREQMWVSVAVYFSSSRNIFLTFPRVEPGYRIGQRKLLLKQKEAHRLV